MNATHKLSRTVLHPIPVYEVRLTRSRKPLRVAETRLTSSTASARALHALIGMTDCEHFACLFVDAMLNITGAHITAIGAQHEIAAIDIRVLLRAALVACASSIVLSHNHPSGDPSPSSVDVATTEVMMRGAELIGIPVLDHVIVTRDERRYHSMFDRGTLPKLRTV